MADKIAGIDAHKKVLMVVVMDARTRRSRSRRGGGSPPCRASCAAYRRGLRNWASKKR